MAGEPWKKMKQSDYIRFIYVSVMRMARNEQLAASSHSFLCRAQLLESVGSDIRHVVYADERSFSGSQLVHGIRAVYVHSADAAQRVLHMQYFLPRLKHARDWRKTAH